MPPVRLVAALLKFDDQIYSRLIESRHTRHLEAFKRMLIESERSNSRFEDLPMTSTFDRRCLLCFSAFVVYAYYPKHLHLFSLPCFYRLLFQEFLREIGAKSGQVTVKPDIVGARFECDRIVSEMNARETGHSSRWFGKPPERSYRETGHS
jgi:hypothetical protein